MSNENFVRVRTIECKNCGEKIYFVGKVDEIRCSKCDLIIRILPSGELEPIDPRDIV